MKNTSSDAALAARHRPVIRLDISEPYNPLFLGYTIARSPTNSPSSKFKIEPKGAVTIEYAVWYDWDIGHLYDLEHVWVHLDAVGEVTVVEASQHGRCEPMYIDGQLPEILDSRPVLFAEPGKHAHWSHPDQIDRETRRRLDMVCGPLAGLEGVHLGNRFAAAGAYSATAQDHRLAKLKMQQDGFIPSFDFTREGDPILVPWHELSEVIPVRVKTAISGLEADVAHIKAVFLDCGDTLVDERTEIKMAGSEVVTKADLIPGAKEMVESLKAVGYKLVLVADGPRQTFVNVLNQHGLWDHFDAHIISEDIGVLKPSAKMFDAALEAVNLTRADTRNVVMVGNNLERDVRGAKALDITSVFMAWSSLRSHQAKDAGDQPDYQIPSPEALPDLIKTLERALQYRKPAFSSAT